MFLQRIESKNLKRNDMHTFSGEIGETKKTNVEDKNSCGGKLTLEKYEHAVTTLCDNKSPGNDRRVYENTLNHIWSISYTGI